MEVTVSTYRAMVFCPPTCSNISDAIKAELILSTKAVFSWGRYY
jgi:hypothetical protein